MLVRALVLVAFTASAAAQTGERDVRVDGVSIVGRWLALSVEGDADASADLRRGDLDIVLAVNPGGHAILRGTDRRQGEGAPAAYSGRVVGDRVAFRDLDGSARLSIRGRRLVLDDPRGRRTVFIRLRDEGVRR